jgi:hypothetical protein
MVFLPSKYESGFTLSIRKTSWIILPGKSKRTGQIISWLLQASLKEIPAIPQTLKKGNF